MSEQMIYNPRLRWSIVNLILRSNGQITRAQLRAKFGRQPKPADGWGKRRPNGKTLSGKPSSRYLGTELRAMRKEGLIVLTETAIAIPDMRVLKQYRDHLKRLCDEQDAAIKRGEPWPPERVVAA